MLYIRTQQGHQYHVNEKGEIIRLDMPGFKPSGGWLFLGLQHVKKNWFIPLSQLTPAMLQSLRPQLLYKNGKPQWTARDRDHGTMREWGDGVAAIQFI